MKELVRQIADLTAEDFTLLEQAVTDNHPQVHLQFSTEDASNSIPPLLAMLLNQLKKDVHTSASDSGVHSESDDSVCETGEEGGEGGRGGAGGGGGNVFLQQLISPINNAIIPATSNSKTCVTEAEQGRGERSGHVGVVDTRPLVQGMHMYRDGVIVSVSQAETTGEQQIEPWTPHHNQLHEKKDVIIFNYQEAVAFLWTGDNCNNSGYNVTMITFFHSEWCSASRHSVAVQ